MYYRGCDIVNNYYGEPKLFRKSVVEASATTNLHKVRNCEASRIVWKD